MARGRPPGTSYDDVVAAARAILEADGAEGFSMRKLATELDASPPAIYRAVGGRDEVIQAVVATLLAESAAIVARGATPAARVRSVVRAMRAQVRQHPFLVHIAREVGQGPALYFPGQLALAQELTAAGLSGAKAAEALRAILYFLGGFIVVESLPPESTQQSSTRELWRDAVDVDPELAAEMSRNPDMDAVFDFTLDRLLSALLP